MLLTRERERESFVGVNEKHFTFGCTLWLYINPTRIELSYGPSANASHMRWSYIGPRLYGTKFNISNLVQCAKNLVTF